MKPAGWSCGGGWDSNFITRLQRFQYQYFEFLGPCPRLLHF